MGSAALVLVAMVVIAAGLQRVRVRTGIESFLPSSDRSVTQLNELARSFGGEPVVVLLESATPKQLLDESSLSKLMELEGTLSHLPDVAVVYGPGSVLNQIAGQMQDLLAELSGRRDGVRIQAEAQARAAGADEAAAKAAGKVAVDAFDARYGPLIVQGLPAGLPTTRNPSFVESVIFSGEPQPRPQWRFVVPSSNAVAILVRPRQGLDAVAAERLVSAVRKSVAAAGIASRRTTISGAPALVAALSSHVEHEMPLLGTVAVVAISAYFLLVPWAPWRRRLAPLGSTLIAIAATLAVYGWLGRTLSLGVVAFLPVLLGIGSFYPTYFARRARPRVVFVVSAATSASFATLALSPLPFVRDLGLTLALGVLLSSAIGWCVNRQFADAAAPLTAGPSVSLRTAPIVARLRPSARVARVVGVVAGVLAVAGWIVLPRMSLKTDFVSYASGLSALDDAQHARQLIGSSGEFDIVLRGPDVTTVQAYTWMRTAQQRTISGYGDRAHPVVSLPSLLDFLGANPTQEQIASGLRFLPTYLAGAAVAPDHSVAVLSFGVDLERLALVQQVIDGVRPIVATPPRGYTAELVGLPVAAARGAKLVSGDRWLSNVLGILASCVVLACGLVIRRDALRAAATAISATGIGLFALWLAGIDLSPLTVTLGALTAAVAAEFTVMLAESRRSGNPRLHRSVALAVATSTTGYLALMASQLAAIREFGLLLAGAVVLAFGCAALVVGVTIRPRRELNAEGLVNHEPPLAIGVM